MRPSVKPGIIYTDDSPELIRACEHVRWNQDASTPHLSEKEVRCAEFKKERRLCLGTNLVSQRDGGTTQWKAAAIA